MERELSDMILSVEHGSKSFPGVKALDDVSLKVGRGVVHGIVGENGAGKSTLMKILSGVYTKDSGTVEFDGQRVEKTTPMESLRRGLSIIYQEFSLISSMTVGENIFLGRFREAGGMKGTHQKAVKLLEQIGSSISTHKFVSELSTSEKQMVEIAKALSFESKLIIMDTKPDHYYGGDAACILLYFTVYFLWKKLLRGGRRLQCCHTVRHPGGADQMVGIRDLRSDGGVLRRTALFEIKYRLFHLRGYHGSVRKLRMCCWRNILCRGCGRCASVLYRAVSDTVIGELYEYAGNQRLCAAGLRGNYYSADPVV